jgi:pimeloyl-ACP methyl ester carboxylesterase
MTGNPGQFRNASVVFPAWTGFDVIVAPLRDSIAVMSTFLLVHGAWHGAWCWHKLMPRLERSGHLVVAPDLPAMGRDRTPVNRVSLATWRKHVCGIVDSLPGPVVLVGHSRGGIVISEVAEHRPERIQTLVYLCAFLPRDGESLFDLAGRDDTSLVPSNMVMSEDKSSSTMRAEVLRDAFYGECSDDDVALARLCLQPEPTLPLATPVKLSAENFGRVPRVYIECLRDRSIPVTLQRRMQEASPCQRVLALDTDHSPFLSKPDELAAMLGGIADSRAER